MKSSLCRRETTAKSPQSRPVSQLWLHLCHERVSYLLICWRQKDFLLFRNWTLGARWGGHTKLPCCQRYSFPRVFVVVWFFTLESKGQSSGFSRGKGWNSRPKGWAAGLSPNDVGFKALLPANPSSSSASIKPKREANYVSGTNVPGSAGAWNAVGGGSAAGFFFLLETNALTDGRPGRRAALRRSQPGRAHSPRRLENGGTSEQDSPASRAAPSAGSGGPQHRGWGRQPGSLRSAPRPAVTWAGRARRGRAGQGRGVPRCSHTAPLRASPASLCAERPAGGTPAGRARSTARPAPPPGRPAPRSAARTLEIVESAASIRGQPRRGGILKEFPPYRIPLKTKTSITRCFALSVRGPLPDRHGRTRGWLWALPVFLRRSNRTEVIFTEGSWRISA